MAKILVVEDDAAVSRTIKECLQSERHMVDAVLNGASALDYFKSFDYDLIILDRQLPDISGTELCKTYRKTSSGAVLMLTGLSTITDKVEGLESGADDYLTKPFDTRELVARVKALVRRNLNDKSDTLSIKDITMDTQSRIVTRSGAKIQLTPKEFDVFEFFLKHPNQVIAPEALLKRVWHSDSEASPHAVYNCLNRLRKNLDAQNKEAFIKTVHGIGYRLEE